MADVSRQVSGTRDCTDADVDGLTAQKASVGNQKQAVAKADVIGADFKSSWSCDGQSSGQLRATHHVALGHGDDSHPRAEPGEGRGRKRDLGLTDRSCDRKVLAQRSAPDVNHRSGMRTHGGTHREPDKHHLVGQGSIRRSQGQMVGKIRAVETNLKMGRSGHGDIPGEVSTRNRVGLERPLLAGNGGKSR